MAVNSNVLPPSSVPESNFAPLTAVTVWAIESSLVNVIFWPTLTLMSPGWNEVSFRRTTAPWAAAGASAGACAAVFAGALAAWSLSPP